MRRMRKYVRKKLHARKLKEADKLVSNPHFERKTLQDWQYGTHANIASLFGVFSTAEYARMEILQQLVLAVSGLCNADKINDDNITEDNKNFTQNHILFVPPRDANLSKEPFNRPEKKSFSAELLPDREIDMGWLSNTHVGDQYLQLRKFIANKLTKIYDGDYDDRSAVRETKQSLFRFLYYTYQKLGELLPLIAGDQSQNLALVIEKLTSLASLCAETRRKNLFCGKDKNTNYPEDEPAGWVQRIAERLQWLAEAHNDYNSNLSLSESLKNCTLFFSSVIEEFGDLLRPYK